MASYNHSLVEPPIGQKRAYDAVALAAMVSEAMMSGSGSTNSSSTSLSSAGFSNNGPDCAVAAYCPMTKRQKVDSSSSVPSCSESEEVVAIGGRDHDDDGSRLSPTDVCADPVMTIARWGSQSKITADGQVSSNKSTGIQVKTLPPTLKGITDAARILRASRVQSLPSGHDQKRTSIPPLLLSFPTESVYMLACCVKAASSRSVSKLLSKTDSHGSLSSLASSKGSVDSIGGQALDPSANPVNRLLEEVIHPPNASLEWMLKCNDPSTAPSLFVCDKEHALAFCHFTKPKTFAIRPPSFSLDAKNSTASNTCSSPRSPSLNANDGNDQSMEGNPLFSPLPVFGGNKAPLTPKSATTSPRSTTSPITPGPQKLQAANFSESREVFLRLASKFWPGPVVFHVQARKLGGEDDVVASSHLSMKSSSSSIGSVPSLPKLGNASAASAGKLAPGTDVVSALPASVLIPSSYLLEGQDGQKNGRLFVGMQCPSHPLSQKILNEVYRGPAPVINGSRPSSGSAASISSMDEQRPPTCKNNRPRSNIAVVGGMVPGFEPQTNDSAKPLNTNSSIAGVTTAVNVGKTMTTLIPNNQGSAGRMFVVDGENNHESFSVPTCQYGRPYPVSLVIDDDNRTIHLMRPSSSKESTEGSMKGYLLTKDLVQRALLKPTSSRYSFMNEANKEKKGGSAKNIDRVITSVLSRWKIEESYYDHL